MGGGGTYPNLFDAHPHFQIVGNFCATAGMTEMLLQSHAGYLSLLPALPAAWKEGTVTGIKARGNFTVDMSWKDGKLIHGKIVSGSGGNCRIRTVHPVKVLGVNTTGATGVNPNLLNTTYGKPPVEKNTQAKLVDIDHTSGYIIDFNTEKGKTYLVAGL